MIFKKKKWFEGAVAYQIYPRSFYDSNGDGIGDLQGIIHKLDYLAGTPDSLGIDVIWLCPFYKSPMADFGYDVADYYSVDPSYGSLNDIRELIIQARNRNIRILVDLVANHTSDEHPWFIDSKTSKDSAKRHWYIWRDGLKGRPPNDWLSAFEGSAWQYDDCTGQYYLHSFSAKQPDLNWANPDVRQAVKEIMHFWLDLGVDGFRADAVYWLSKDHRYRNDPLKDDAPSPGHPEYNELQHTYSRNGHQLYKYLREMTQVLNEYKDKFMVVEAYPEGGKAALEYQKFYQYIDAKHLAPFNFEGVFFPWDAPVFKTFISQFQKILRKSDLAVYTFGNHDQSRLASRIGEFAAPSAAVLLLTLPGMPFIYYGEEIGMSDAYIPPALRKDPLSLHGDDRDKVRTPMQWDSSTNAGFCSNKPWLPVPKDFRKINVAAEKDDRGSIFKLYLKLINIRKKYKALSLGSYQSLDTKHDCVYGFMRKYGREKLITLVNFSSNPATANCTGLKGKIVLSSYQDSKHKAVNSKIALRPNEAVIIKP